MAMIKIFDNHKINYYCHNTRNCFLCIIGVLILSGCEGEVYPPKKPDVLPVEAIFINGHGFDIWASCNPTGNTTIECKVYNEKTGDVTEKMNLRVCFNITWGEGSYNNPRPIFFDSGRAILNGVELRIDQSTEYYPIEGSDYNESWLDQKVIEKEFKEHGVDNNCQPQSSL